MRILATDKGVLLDAIYTKSVLRHANSDHRVWAGNDRQIIIITTVRSNRGSPEGEGIKDNNWKQGIVCRYVNLMAS